MLATLISLLAVNNLATPNPELSLPPLSPPTIAAHPVKTGLSLQPQIEAKAVLSIDLETGAILYGQNQNSPLPMASLTKLMTVLIILKENGLDETVIVDKRATTVEPSKMYLLANEKISTGELIKAILIKSANDAALALAYHNAGELEGFVAKMNYEATAMGMTQTHFQNPTGLDAPDQYSSPEDLALLARTVYKYPIVRQTAPMAEITVSSTDQKQQHKLENTNALLDSYLKVLGLKTGTTDDAGQCLITIVESAEGRQIMNIMLNSPARFQESKILSQWIFNNYSWI